MPSSKTQQGKPEQHGWAASPCPDETRPALTPTPRLGCTGQLHTLRPFSTTAGSSSASRTPPRDACQPCQLGGSTQRRSQVDTKHFKSGSATRPHEQPLPAREVRVGTPVTPGDGGGGSVPCSLQLITYCSVGCSGCAGKALAPLLKPPQSFPAPLGLHNPLRKVQSPPGPRGRFRAESSTAQLPASPAPVPGVVGLPLPGPGGVSGKCRERGERQEEHSRDLASIPDTSPG